MLGKGGIEPPPCLAESRFTVWCDLTNIRLLPLLCWGCESLKIKTLLAVTATDLKAIYSVLGSRGTLGSCHLQRLTLYLRQKASLLGLNGLYLWELPMLFTHTLRMTMLI